MRLWVTRASAASLLSHSFLLHPCSLQGTTVKCLAFYDSPFWRKGAEGGNVVALVRR